MAVTRSGTLVAVGLERGVRDAADMPQLDDDLAALGVHGIARPLTEHFLLVLAPEMAKQLGRRPTAERLARLPLIAFDEDLPLIRPVRTALFQFAPTLQAALTIADLHIIQDLVVKGHGWSVLPDYQCAEALESGRLVLIIPRQDAPTNNLYLVWNKTVMRNPRIVHVRDFILEMFGSDT